MKRKSLLLCSAATLLSLGALAGCSAGGGKTLTVWVGEESTAFYQKVCDQFVADNPDFGYKIKIVAADAGSAAGSMVTDNTACGDIVTIAHDNIGKLSQSSYIAPLTNQDLLKQIDQDNPDSFKQVIVNTLGKSEEKYTFGAPYISQALFLYYDTRYVTDEQAKTFEGLKEAAAALGSNVKGWAITGTDGYNYSFNLLMRNVTDGKNTSPLRLYENGVRYDSYAQDNEELASLRWAQRQLADPNGMMFPDDSGWEVNVKAHKLLSVIGGAWHYKAFKNVTTDEQGVSHIGCAVIPTYTLTAEDVEGITDVAYPADDQYAPQGQNAAPKVGDVYRGGSFVDCKCLVINYAASADQNKYQKLEQLIMYLASKDVQKASFVEAMNVPAFKGSEEYVESVKGQVDDSIYAMAKAQTGMNEYGIAQPFLSGQLNTYFYSKSAPDYYKEAVINEKGAYNELDKLRETLFKMEYIWKHGGLPKTMPGTYPAATDAKQ